MKNRFTFRIILEFQQLAMFMWSMGCGGLDESSPRKTYFCCNVRLGADKVAPKIYAFRNNKQKETMSRMLSCDEWVHFA